MSGLPIVDVAPLVAAGEGGDRSRDPEGSVSSVAAALDAAFRADGFALVVGHGVDPALRTRLEAAARAFFARPEAEKARIAMPLGGRAWRGWFPLGGELTSGRPDQKEGLYLGRDLPADDPRVRAGRPLHGPNLWPVDPPELRPAVEAWTAAMEDLSQALLGAVALGLGLDADWFARQLTDDPTILFRIFRYPPVGPDHGDGGVEGWGVAEHTDYGLLTLLAQDHHGGLEVRGPDGWVDVPAEPGALVVNLGDMLDRMTGGRYRSTPHRVRASRDGDRLSFPFFLDPSWDAEVRPLPLDGDEPPDDAAHRWDGTSLRELTGTYGDYLTAKVAKVFPALRDGLRR